MVGTRRPSPLQQQINTDAQWVRMLQKEGLTVVDIYSEWCGPCAAMLPNLKKLKRTIGGRNLHLALAKSDTISHLEQFRDRSEPTWMFLIGGKVVNMMYGANFPKLQSLIVEELKKEAAIKEGRRERVEVEISEPPKEMEESKTDIEAVNEVPESEKEENVIISDEDFMYRPF